MEIIDQAEKAYQHRVEACSRKGLIGEIMGKSDGKERYNCAGEAGGGGKFPPCVDLLPLWLLDTAN